MSDVSEFQDWQVTLNFRVPAGDEDAVIAAALFDKAVAIAPDAAVGFVAGGNTTTGTVEIEFTLLEASRELCAEIAHTMQDDLDEMVASSSEPCITAG